MRARTWATIAAPLPDGGSPYMKGRNRFTRLGSISVEAERLPGAVRVEFRSTRWTPDPPALVMMHPADALELAAALVAAATDTED